MARIVSISTHMLTAMTALGTVLSAQAYVQQPNMVPPSSYQQKVQMPYVAPQAQQPYSAAPQPAMQQPAYNQRSYTPAPAPQPVAATPPPAHSQRDAQVMAITAQVQRVEERMQRVERAMLRLDRRMQLVERNELNRMGDATSTPAAGYQPASLDLSAAPARSPQRQARATQAPSANVQRIAAPDRYTAQTVVTSALQAAPSVNSSVPSAIKASGHSVGRNGLPSLADVASASPSKQDDGGQVAIWTVQYEQEKIWPHRRQLASSREVVESLRQGGSVAIYARGQNPNSREFRERVRALSRYLSKVSNVERVAIATLPATHLNQDTIEIFTAQ